jgi:hypothetical protein
MIWIAVILFVFAFMIDSHQRQIIKRLESIESILMGRGQERDDL